MQPTVAVRARQLTKCYGHVVALDGVDLDIPVGQVHGLAGPNGAGKSTLLGLLLGVGALDRGSLQILGRPLGRRHAVPDGVAGFVDGPGLYPALTARRNLTALAGLRGGGAAARARARVDDVLAEVGLDDVAAERVGGFSLGMRQRLGLAAALLAEPSLLILDEPANGLDPSGRRHVHRVIARLAAQGTTVLLSSHRMDDLAELCAEVTLLATGRVVFTGPAHKLAAESGAVEHRVITTDPDGARRIADRIRSLRVAPVSPPRSCEADRGELRVRGTEAALDELVTGLVRERIGVRELAPVVPPLEQAFLNLTGADPAGQVAPA